MDYSLTTILHTTKSRKQNTKEILNNYREKEKKAGLAKTQSIKNAVFSI
jgi:hypothetical protein